MVFTVTVHIKSASQDESEEEEVFKMGKFNLVSSVSSYLVDMDIVLLYTLSPFMRQISRSISRLSRWKRSYFLREVTGIGKTFKSHHKYQIISNLRDL